MSLLIDGRRIVTADVFALTTRAETQAAARTPPAAFCPVDPAAGRGAASSSAAGMEAISASGRRRMPCRPSSGWDRSIAAEHAGLRCDGTLDTARATLPHPPG